MKVCLISEVLRALANDVENKFRAQFYSSDSKVPDYQFYGYNSSTRYTYDEDKPSLKSELLNALKSCLESDNEYLSFLVKLKGGRFNGKNLRDKKSEASQKNHVTIDANYIVIYLNYLERINIDEYSIEERIRNYIKQTELINDESKKILLEKQNIAFYEPKKKAVNLRYICFYAKDDQTPQNFIIEIDHSKKEFTIDQTTSKKIYEGSYSTFDSHTSMYAQTPEGISIHLAIYTGREIIGNVLFGQMTLIGKKGKVITTSVVLLQSNSKKIEYPSSILRYLYQNNILKINHEVETVENFNQFENLMSKKSKFNSIKGIYSAYIVSAKRKIIVPFAIEIDEYGRVESHRKNTENRRVVSRGMTYYNDSKAVLIDINIDPLKGKSFSEYRIVLTMSGGRLERLKFIIGVYCGFSVDSMNPRAGRICFCPEDVESLHDLNIDTIPIDKNSESYQKLINTYEYFENFFKGEKDSSHLIENLQTFDQS